ncbi:hypothetical protein KP509_04G104100 [Ceratopteris richardii]|uniref:Armadillo repeat-containing protein 6 n=1 Tax=Ceratopteris richardii TaxID=49495 RepID=A0A8T2UZV1_CERRI|nr:hypothetical protein KP509_04G104100 [Ceratopteris richardii]
MTSSRKGLQISQEAFDAVVKENMEDFGMDLQEALQDAIHTFKLQGADLKGIITDGSKDENPTNAPVVEIIKELQNASSGAGAITIGHVQNTLHKFHSLCKEGGINTISIAGRHGGVEASISLVRALDDRSVMNLVLEVLSVLTEDTENMGKFKGNGGLQLLMSVLKDLNKDNNTIRHACTLLSSAAKGDEVSKEQFMDLNAAEVLPKLIKECMNDGNLVIFLCNAFRALVTSDDSRVVASKAFMNARTFAENGMVEALLLASSQLQGSSSAITSICMALKSLAVNENICKSIAEQKGIDFILQVMAESIKICDKSVAKSACSFLSQIAMFSLEERVQVIQDGTSIANIWHGTFQTSARSPASY